MVLAGDHQAFQGQRAVLAFEHHLALAAVEAQRPVDDRIFGGRPDGDWCRAARAIASAAARAPDEAAPDPPTGVGAPVAPGNCNCAAAGSVPADKRARARAKRRMQSPKASQAPAKS